MTRIREAAPRTGRAAAARARGWLLAGSAIAAVIGLLWVAVVAAPRWFVDNETLEGLKAQNDVRTTLLQGVVGMALLLGVYFTWRQLHTAREGQMTERYTRAIDQLGHAEPDVRLGGIYALERIARDSRNDRITIGEVLTAFVRGHAPWPPSLQGQYTATAPIDEVPELQRRAPDVHAAMKVLGRGGFAPPLRWADDLDLNDVDLRRADLLEANLQQAMLRNARLDKAFLLGTRLERAILHNARLDGAGLFDAHLEGASLEGAELEGALDLDRAHLEGALADDETTWPAGFDWRAAGVIMSSKHPPNASS